MSEFKGKMTEVGKTVWSMSKDAANIAFPGIGVGLAAIVAVSPMSFGLIVVDPQIIMVMVIMMLAVGITYAIIKRMLETFFGFTAVEPNVSPA